MIFHIKQLGEPVLRQKSEPISLQEEGLEELVNGMLDTMIEAEGVGLAAPQIGLLKQLVVIDIPEEEDSVTKLLVNGQEMKLEECMPLVMLNPEIIELKGKKVPYTEGCLSLFRYRCDVHRPETAVVRYTQMDGTQVEVEANGLLGRCFQHEIDHLNGILFIDRISSAHKLTLKKKLAKLGLPVVPAKPKKKD